MGDSYGGPWSGSSENFSHNGEGGLPESWVEWVILQPGGGYIKKKKGLGPDPGSGPVSR